MARAPARSCIDPDPAETRLRHLPQDVAWPVESSHERALRRRRLAECDALLGAIEEHNAIQAGRPVPELLIDWYRHLGGVRVNRALRNGSTLIEAVFELQRPCVRYPILPAEPVRRRHRT